MSERSFNINDRKRSVTILDPGVSLVKKSVNEDGALAIILKVLLAFAFMAAGLLAILYSINNAEDPIDDKPSNETVDAFGAIYNNQVCLNGVITTEKIINNEKKISKKSVEWMQDHDNNRLFFNITDDETGNFTSYYVYPDKVVMNTDKSCALHDHITGYFDFIKSMALQGLKKARIETVDIQGKKKQVQIYQGKPILSNFYDGSGEIPMYTQGYEGLDNGVLYGWQLFYEADPDGGNGTEWAEYWFPEMKRQKPDPNVFINIPHACYGYKHIRR
ncbi:unnamed protein product [Bursaphelenchus xylophilus]|uniref:(pine wood nematode) hypothetical protein n=1 Tax=Bursaphelenchus xylophilus TaxID=6326 RepID=A0A1I7SVV3_BURXY|nr:unnamed protein product [Bursaphelenchus xylophilus]CAG9098328.1 unnamed protein product [Bursaphelenchus xylophilus]